LFSTHSPSPTGFFKKQIAGENLFSPHFLTESQVSKLGIKNQRLQAAWDDEFAEKLFNFFSSENQQLIG
ncbi:MAG: hypothetical protein AAGI49_09895, partial [Bacteroidota bacterium]